MDNEKDFTFNLEASKMKQFFKEIDKVLISGLTVFIFFVLGFIWWIWSADTAVPMWLLSLVIIICYIICIIIYAVCSTRSKESVYRLPKIKSIYKDENKIIFIVEKNDLYSQGSYATICYQSDPDQLEITIGLGYVQSTTSAGFLQISIERLINDSNVNKIVNKIENTAVFRNSILIKPSIHKELWEGN